MCLNEKLSHNIKVRSRISEFFLLKKNDFLKLSVNFQEQIQSFLSNSLLKYLKFNDEKKKIIRKYEKDHPEMFKHEEGAEHGDNEHNLEQIKEDSEEDSNEENKTNKKGSSSPSKTSSSMSEPSTPSKAERSSTKKKSTAFLRAPQSLMTRINSINSQTDEYNSIFEIKQEVDNVKKNMYKNFSKNLEKMLGILEKNKSKFEYLDQSENPLFYLNKLKNAKDQIEREEYLNHLRILIEEGANL